MNTELYIAKKIIFSTNSTNSLSKPIIKIAISSVAIGIAVMIIAMAIVTGFQQEIRNKVMGLSSGIQISNYDANNSQEPTPFIFSSDLKSLIQVKGVKHIQEFATKNGIIKTKTDNEGVLLKGVNKNFDWSFFQKNLLEGDVIHFKDSNASKEIVISNYLANKLELKVNDKMLIYFVTKTKSSSDQLISNNYEQRVKDFYIKGIYETGFEEFDKQLVLLDISQIRKLNYWNNNEIGGLEIAVSDYNTIDKVTDEINDRIDLSLKAESVKDTNPAIFSWLDLQDMNAIIVIVLMILVASINMITILLILILEKTNTIGLLKALGARNSSIQKIFLYHAAYIIGKGLLIGNIVALLICIIQDQFQIFKLNKETYYLEAIPINIEISHILFLNLLTIITNLIILIFPSFLISKISPVKALRFS